LGIISVGFYITDQVLIRSLAFVRCWRKNRSTMRQYQLFIDFKKASQRSVGPRPLYTWTLTHPMLFDPEDGGSMYLWNISNIFHIYSVESASVIDHCECLKWVTELSLKFWNLICDVHSRYQYHYPACLNTQITMSLVALTYKLIAAYLRQLNATTKCSSLMRALSGDRKKTPAPCVTVIKIL
jgi:hypothetical protein